MKLFFLGKVYPFRRPSLRMFRIRVYISARFPSNHIIAPHFWRPDLASLCEWHSPAFSFRWSLTWPSSLNITKAEAPSYCHSALFLRIFKKRMEFLELWVAIVLFFAVSIWVSRQYHIRPLLRRMKDQVCECLNNFEHSIKHKKLKFLMFLSRNLSVCIWQGGG